jgi:hypothetical protein
MIRPFSSSVPSFVHALVLTLVSILTFLAYGRSHFYRDPGSLFYDKSRAYERYYSLRREQEAVSFGTSALNAYSEANGPDAFPKTGPNPLLTAAIITSGKKRDGTGKHPLEVRQRPFPSLTHGRSHKSTLVGNHKLSRRANKIRKTRPRSTSVLCKHNSIHSSALELMAPQSH